MLQGEITLKLLGEYRVHQDSVTLLKVTCEDGLQGIIDVEFNTIVPLKYCAIKMTELRDNVMFIILLLMWCSTWVDLWILNHP